MLLPWNTDAPIYHFPWATIGLIAVNTLVFFATLEAPDAEQWCLAYGDGLQPIQWITSNFMHSGFMHLVGNMIFLWGFGLVIEGKLGWWRFLLVYLGIGAIECAAEQMAMQDRIGYAMGASSIIYGLLAMSVVWAPQENQPHRAEVRKLLVHPDCRRLGIARRLMAKLERCAGEIARSTEAQSQAASAMAASAQGGQFLISTLASQPFEAITEAGRSPEGTGPWFQLYWQRDRPRTLRLLEKAASAGCSTRSGR